MLPAVLFCWYSLYKFPRRHKVEHQRTLQTLVLPCEGFFARVKCHDETHAIPPQVIYQTQGKHHRGKGANLEGVRQIWGKQRESFTPAALGHCHQLPYCYRHPETAI